MINKPDAKLNIIRLNITKSFKIVKKCKAGEIGSSFELDDTYRNHYFVPYDKISYEEPRLIRENVYYLKSEITESKIYVLALQSTDNKIIKASKPKKVEAPTTEMCDDPTE